VVAELALVRLRRQPPVLRPLDLGGEVARRPELVRGRQRVADLAEEQRLRREDLADATGCEVVELGEGRRMEGACRNTRDAEPPEPRAHLSRSLVGEGHREDLIRPKRLGRDLSWRSAA